MSNTQKAVFLDRDGVLNKLVWNPLTTAYESPHCLKDLIFCSDIIKPLEKLKQSGYKLFIVSNQPSYAKGKTTLKALKQIAEKFGNELKKNGVQIEKSFYCYHHPDGIVPEYTKKCACRKPKPFFLFKAQKKYKLNLKESWMIGDRDSDIECGRRAGCKTILIKNLHSADYQHAKNSDYTANNLRDAVKRIIAEAQKKRSTYELDR